ncbi:uncharacterized protein DUF4296 [Algoriphagus boseongensis]|uniref:Uncharacterized protein DUF4296 n=1 Tax=Algoriphagus boseongensis TaxID=1442587 RepID=A0A4R6T4I2_9BACT|nr:DUF4296 domain-containing protein [Algoriphagus boseongensis]TDQ13514.1 uncharacterized protein DUF4296 [Algoriphagus boseongensis]
MKRILLPFLILIFASSCLSKKKTPEGLLDEEQMVAILLDIQLTEGIVSALPIPYDSSTMVYGLLEKEIFLKHGVPDSVFTSSMKYYLEDAAMMEKIYARVIDSLMVKEANPGIEERM